MQHPATELRKVSDRIGVGVFATAPLPKGTITWVRDDLDLTLTPERFRAVGGVRAAFLKKWVYRDRRGDYVCCWDIAKHVNHSFLPSTMTTPWELEIAIRDIAPGEEITLDYGTLNEHEAWTPAPEPGAARTVVSPDDLLHHSDEWDRLIAGALTTFADVDQPLLELVDPGALGRMRESVGAPRPLDSIRACHFAGV